MSDKTEFHTKDLNQAAFVWCQDGAKLVEVVPKNERGTTVHFIFELDIDKQELAKLILDYANNDTLVDPLEYSQRQSSLRDLLYSCLQKYKSKH